MTRYGIGPKFSAAAALYGLPAGWLTYRYPEVFSIRCIPYLLLVGVGAALLLAGGVIYARVLRTFNAGYRQGKLVREGAFSIVRHPIYAAWIWLIIPGFVLFFRSWPLLAAPLVAYVAFKVFVHEEDASLRREFGESYSQYRSETNEMFPFRRQ